MGKSDRRIVDPEDRVRQRRRSAPTCGQCGQYLRRDDDLGYCDECFALIEQDIKEQITELDSGSWVFPLWK